MQIGLFWHTYRALWTCTHTWQLVMHKIIPEEDRYEEHTNTTNTHMTNTKNTQIQRTPKYKEHTDTKNTHMTNTHNTHGSWWCTTSSLKRTNTKEQIYDEYKENPIMKNTHMTNTKSTRIHQTDMAAGDAQHHLTYTWRIQRTHEYKEHTYDKYKRTHEYKEHTHDEYKYHT